MNSVDQTSSYKQEFKVVAVVLVFLFLLELCARYLAPHLDYDRMHISKFDNIVAEAPQNEQDLSIIGNSLLMHGFDTTLFNEKLPSVHITKITPVGTAIHDWDMIFNRYFEKTDTLPSRLVIGFVAHHIDDSEPVKLRRLARHFATVEALPYLWKHENLDFHQKAQSFLSHYSSVIGDQPEHRLRSLEFIIPQYRTGLNLNQDFVSNASQSDSAAAENKTSFHRVSRFLANCKKHGIQVYLIPMPQPEIWDMNPEINVIAERYGATLLDARNIDTMSEADFSDGYHLGDTGIVKFTNWLADTFVTIESIRN